MNKSEPVGDWVKKQGTINVRYGEVLELIHEIRTKRENLGLEFGEWIDWAEEAIAALCVMFDIDENEVK